MIDFNEIEAQLTGELKSDWDNLLDSFRQMGSAAIAFSGGVDSGLLCAAAYRALGDHMLAVTVSSPVESLGDVNSAKTLASMGSPRNRLLSEAARSIPNVARLPTPYPAAPPSIT